MESRGLELNPCSSVPHRWQPKRQRAWGLAVAPAAADQHAVADPICQRFRRTPAPLRWEATGRILTGAAGSRRSACHGYLSAVDLPLRVAWRLYPGSGTSTVQRLRRHRRSGRNTNTFICSMTARFSATAALSAACWAGLEGVMSMSCSPVTVCAATTPTQLSHCCGRSTYRNA